jgi:hypothetical protein
VGRKMDVPRCYSARPGRGVDHAPRRSPWPGYHENMRCGGEVGEGRKAKRVKIQNEPPAGELREGEGGGGEEGSG